MKQSPNIAPSIEPGKHNRNRNNTNIAPIKASTPPLQNPYITLTNKPHNRPDSSKTEPDKIRVLPEQDIKIKT